MSVECSLSFPTTIYTDYSLHPTGWVTPMSGEHVLICVAWPYANGHALGHVSCYLPPDIQARFERARGNALMVSGSDEHDTNYSYGRNPRISPQEVVDKYHAINTKALLDLGCTWEPNIDPRGVEFGGSLSIELATLNITIFQKFPFTDGCRLFERKVMQQYYEVREDGGAFT